MIWTPYREDKAPISVNVSSQDALLLDLSQRMLEGQGFAVATINLDHVVKLHRDDSFRNAYAGQTHVTADGRPIVWLSRLAGDNLGLVTGSDFVRPFMTQCANLSVPVAFFGATSEVLEIAAQEMMKRNKGLSIVAKIAPPMGFDPESDEAKKMICELAASGAKVCLLALGAPKQEVFAARALRLKPQMGFVSIGASLDFIAGTQVRSPAIVRKLAVEWMWRLLGNPRRLGLRYAACFMILPRLVLRALRIRVNGNKSEPRQSGET